MNIATITRAISVRQPWAWLIVNGHKTFENRGRAIARAGTYWLHTGANTSIQEVAAAIVTTRNANPQIIEVLRNLTADDLPLGGIIGWVTLGEFQRGKTEDPWSFGAGYPITAAGVLPFTPCRGAIGVFKPAAVPAIESGEAA